MTTQDVNQPNPADTDDPAGTPPVTDATATPDGATPDLTAPESNDPTVLRAQLTEANRKADEYLALLKRERADVTNFRRRVEEERARLVREAGLDVILKLLPVLDDFERALASARPEDLQSDWARGVQLIERNLRAVLAAQDVQRIEADGASFDPWAHEAVSYVPSADVPEGHVMHVVRPGYKSGDRVIRPAQVVVAGRPQ